MKKRVLFVDGEPQILEGLRVRLHRLRSTWHMEFVESGKQAIEAMQACPFDVIVTDLNVLDMNGLVLLKHVQEHWPDTIRIVLSLQADLEQATQLLPVAHQYLRKPCDEHQLENVVGRCLSLQTMLRGPALRKLVGRLGRLPPVPKVYAQLQKAMASDVTSVADIARIVERDTVIAAKLLQMVNSGFFRMPRRVTNIEQAVGYLGLTTVRNLVISAEVFSMWPASAITPPLQLETMQLHAMQVTAVVRSLAGRSVVANDAMLAALLHDIGYWVLSQEVAQELLEAQKMAIRNSIPMDVAEQRVFGASHAEVGAYLLGLWGFPAPIIEAVANHHAPTRIEQTEFDALTALCVAHAHAKPPEGQAFTNVTIFHSEVDPTYLDSVPAPFSWDEAQEHAATLSAEEMPVT